MDAQTFCYWLQGLFELDSSYGTEKGLTVEQTLMIKEHLHHVFTHVVGTPPTGTPPAGIPGVPFVTPNTNPWDSGGTYVPRWPSDMPYPIVTC